MSSVAGNHVDSIKVVRTCHALPSHKRHVTSNGRQMVVARSVLNLSHIVSPRSKHLRIGEVPSEAQEAIALNGLIVPSQRV